MLSFLGEGSFGKVNKGTAGAGGDIGSRGASGSLVLEGHPRKVPSGQAVRQGPKSLRALGASARVFT